SSKKIEIYEKIFKIFELFFSDDPSSMDRFCLIYFKNLKEHGLFEEHIDNIKKFFFLSDLSWHDALKYLICFPLVLMKAVGRDGIFGNKLWFNLILSQGCYSCIS